MTTIKKIDFKHLLLGVLILCISNHCLSQNEPAQKQTVKSDFWNKVRFGGGVGLGFGNNSFNGSLAPSAIYQANQQWALGLGLNVSYSKFDTAKLFTYGASALSFYNPIREIQLSAEFEQLRVKRSFENNLPNSLNESYWYPALYMGVGYTSRNVTFGIRYDVLYDEDTSIYRDPWAPFVRVYF